MGKSVIKRLLVIGPSPDEKASIYSADTKVEPYVKFKFEDRHKLRENQLKVLEAVLNSNTIKLSNLQKELYRNMYIDTQQMDDEMFYDSITEGFDIDETTADAYTTENPLAKYKYHKCYDSILKKEGRESDFSNPFKLRDGTTAYMAHNYEIDWPKNHMYNTKIYKAAWEVCVDGRKPVDEMEEKIKKNMENRKEYFRNFKNVDEYVKHCCSFWTDCVITEDESFYEIDYKTSDMEWISNFYDRFVKDLPGNVLLTLYEVRTLEN